MTNRYAVPMSKRTDKDLIKIITVERDSYEPLAVEAAMAEIEKRNLDTSLIEETKKYVAEEFEKQEALNDQVGLGIRFVHLVVDTIAYHVLTFILLIAVIYIVPSRADDLVFLQTAGLSLFLLSVFLYYVLMEHLFQKTIGKYITGTKVVHKNGEKASLADIFVRTVYRFLPFDSITFYTRENGFHDEFSNTMVIRDKKK